MTADTTVAFFLSEKNEFKQVSNFRVKQNIHSEYSGSVKQIVSVHIWSVKSIIKNIALCNELVSPSALHVIQKWINFTLGKYVISETCYGMRLSMNS